MEALKDLPSRGCLVAGSAGIVGRPPKAYVADHDTAPPESQQISTDPENILIRSITSGTTKAFIKGNNKKQLEKNKRPAEENGASAAPKRSRDEAGPSGQGGSGSGPQIYTAEQLRGKTAAQLMEILKARGLPVRGKKEELVQRLLEAQDRARRTAANPA